MNEQSWLLRGKREEGTKHLKELDNQHLASLPLSVLKAQLIFTPRASDEVSFDPVGRHRACWPCN